MAWSSASRGPAMRIDERQQGEHRRLRREALEHRLVAAHAGVVVEVARLGHADDRMDEEIGLRLLGGGERQLAVRAVHRVAGLERHHPAPAAAGQLLPHLGRGEAQGPEVVMGGELQAFEAAGEGDPPLALVEVGDAGVLAVGGAEDRLGDGLAFALPGLLDFERREHDAFGVAQRQRRAGAEPRP